MAFLNSLNISGSALTAQKLRMNIISQNIANASTTRTQDGGPYVRQMVVFKTADQVDSFYNALEQANNGYGVEVEQIVQDPNGTKQVYNPSHPDADENGYLSMPNINTVQEMTDMMSASRSYEANITAFNAVKLMATKALEIGR